MARRRGFSLIELMVVVTVIGVLAAMAAPSYQRAIVQSRADIAAANLRAIWAAQRVYWMEYHSYTDKLRHQTPPAVGLIDMKLLDPTVFDTNLYSYEVASFSDNAFAATASSADGGVTISIDESGTIQAVGITLTYH